jgi:K+-sensing histidine kinase KdpD
VIENGQDLIVVETKSGRTLSAGFFYTTKPDGLGMGLSITRGIIGAQGGTMEASNNREGGATFAFTLPAPFQVHS